MLNRTLPDPIHDTNLTDTNGAPGAMDEDGELDSLDDSNDVNQAPEPDAEEPEDEDTTPPIHSLSMHTGLVDGKEQTAIIATVCSKAIHSKEEVEYEVNSVVKDEEGRVQKDPVTGKVIFKTEKLKHFPIITPGGVTSKRLVVPGGVTAYQLANHIYNIESW